MSQRSSAERHAHEAPGDDAGRGAEVLRAEGVCRSFGEGAAAVRVLRGASLSIRRGELVLLEGPSGSGKTTLVSVLAGLLHPSAGRVTLCGVDLGSLDEAARTQLRGRHVGFVFQSFPLFAGLSARDNVAEVLALRGTDIKVARRRADEVLRAVGLGDHLTAQPEALSSGQRQRVAIARAIAGEPALLLGDEPTASLDGATALEVAGLLRAQADAGAAVLLVTHDQRLERFADRVLALRDGVVEPAHGARS